MALEDLHDLLFGHGSDDLLGHLSALKNEEGGDTADIEFPGSIDVLIDVELYDLQLARIFAGDLFHRRRKHVARAAPVRPKINHDGLRFARLDHVVLKVCVIYCLNVVCHCLPLCAHATTLR